MNLKSLKIHADLKWLMPYLDSVADLVPVDRIVKIAYYKGEVGHDAITHRLANNKNYKIFISTNLNKEERVPLDSYHQEVYLTHLAHELGHLVHWEHGKNHFKLTGKIFYKFSKVLGKIGFEEERNKC